LIPTFSPQGDGNDPGMRSRTIRSVSLIPTFSPQGDGNSLIRGEGDDGA